MKYKYNNQWKDLNVKVSDTYPIGAIAPYGGETAPTNWLICDGSAVSRTTYADLFNVIGTSFGSGDGSTTFNLPDLRSKVPLGKDSRDTDFDTIGKTYGEKEHTLTIDEMPSHNHPLEDKSYPTQTAQLGGRSDSGGSYGKVPQWAQTDSYSAYGTKNIGGGQAHNIVQPSLVTNYIIKAFQSTGVVGNVAQTYTESNYDTYSCNYVNLIGKTIMMRGNSEQTIPANTVTKVTNTTQQSINQFTNNEITYSNGDFTINSDRIHTIIVNTQLFLGTSAESYQYIHKNSESLLNSSIVNIKHPETLIIPVSKNDIISVHVYVTSQNKLRNDFNNMIQITVLG